MTAPFSLAGCWRRSGAAFSRRPLMVLALAAASALFLTGCVVGSVLPGLGWAAMGIGALLLLIGCSGSSGGGGGGDSATTIDLGELVAASGLFLSGEAAGDRAGWSVAGDGDGNGDGFDDVLVGAPYHDNAGSNTGEGYVIFGDSNLPGSASLANVGSNPDGGMLFHVTCAPDTWTGFWVSWLPDTGIGFLSPNGYDDILITSPGDPIFSNSGLGTAFVVAGSSGLADVSLTGGSPIYAYHNYDQLSGLIVGDGGDFGGTGDAVVFADQTLYEGQGQVRVYVNIGNSGLDFDTSGSNDALIVYTCGAQPNDYLGASIDLLGDIGGNANDDIIIGAPGEDSGGTNRGAAYVVFGRDSISAHTYQTVDNLGSTGFTIAGESNNDRLGQGVAGIDWNNDGVPDMAIGAPGNGSTPGKVYIVYGVDGATSDIDLADLTADDGFVLTGEANGDRFGFVLSNAGDLDGDGVDDLAVGASYADDEAGRVYILFGNSNLGSSGSVDIADLEVAQGVILTGESAGDKAGRALSPGGDIDGDGNLDLLVGAPYEDTGGNNAGAVYVLFGFDAP